MKKITSCFLALLVVLVSFGQKTETVYLNPLDSTSNMYVIIYPPKIPLKGFMFLIPSFGEAPTTVLSQTKIPNEAAQQGILTVVPTFKTGPYSLGVDTATQSSFLEILDHIISRHKLIDTKFYVGGFLLEELVRLNMPSWPTKKIINTNLPLSLQLIHRLILSGSITLQGVISGFQKIFSLIRNLFIWLIG